MPSGQGTAGTATRDHLGSTKYGRGIIYVCTPHPSAVRQRIVRIYSQHNSTMGTESGCYGYVWNSSHHKTEVKHAHQNGEVDPLLANLKTTYYQSGESMIKSIKGKRKTTSLGVKSIIHERQGSKNWNINLVEDKPGVRQQRIL